MSGPSWSLVVTLTGPAELAVPFVAHHLDTGAQRIHVYLDRPDPALQALLAAEPRCLPVLCDDAYWKARRGRRGRPEGLVSRQLTNAEHARSVTGSDWIIHLDSDEFLYEMQPLAAALAEVPAGTDWLHIPNVERVFLAGTTPETVFDGLFRSHVTPPRAAEAIWGDVAPFLRNGLAAYVGGKIGIRRSSPLKMGLHSAATGTEGEAPPPAHPARGVAVRHVDGWTPRHWTRKIQSLRDRVALSGHKGGHRGRQEQIAWFGRTSDPAERLDLYRRLHVLDESRAAALRAAGALHDMPLDPRPAIARHFPQVAFSWSPADVDALQAAPAAAAPAG